MNKHAWKNLDLHGGGVQSLNLLLAKKMKKHSIAYALWFFFPLGLHRAYLKSKFFTFVYIVLSIVATTGILFVGVAGIIFSLPLVMLALFDLIWIDRRVTSLNKELRKQIYLQRTEGPPKDYRGRYPEDEKEDIETENAPHRILSFNEQEALLKEMAKKKKAREEN